MDAGKVQHAPATATITMLADRHGWFWPAPLVAGETYDLPVDVAEYLVGLNVATAAKAKAEAKAEAKAKLSKE
jgi:hypothetical protein